MNKKSLKSLLKTGPYLQGVSYKLSKSVNPEREACFSFITGREDLKYLSIKCDVPDDLCEKISGIGSKIGPSIDGCREVELTAYPARNFISAGFLRDSYESKHVIPLFEKLLSMTGVLEAFMLSGSTSGNSGHQFLSGCLSGWYEDKDRELVPARLWVAKYVTGLQNDKKMRLPWNLSPVNEWVTKDAGCVDVEYARDKSFLSELYACETIGEVKKLVEKTKKG